MVMDGNDNGRGDGVEGLEHREVVLTEEQLSVLRTDVVETLHLLAGMCVWSTEFEKHIDEADARTREGFSAQMAQVRELHGQLNRTLTGIIEADGRFPFRKRPYVDPGGLLERAKENPGIDYSG